MSQYSSIRNIWFELTARHFNQNKNETKNTPKSNSQPKYSFSACVICFHRICGLWFPFRLLCFWQYWYSWHAVAFTVCIVYSVHCTVCYLLTDSYYVREIRVFLLYQNICDISKATTCANLILFRSHIHRLLYCKLGLLIACTISALNIFFRVIIIIQSFDNQSFNEIKNTRFENMNLIQPTSA